MSDAALPTPVEKQDRPIRFSDTFLAILASLGGTLVFGAGLGIVLGMWWAATKQPGSLSEILQTNFYAVVGFTSAINAVILLLLFAVAKRFTNRPIRYFFPAVPTAAIAKAAASALVLMALCLALEMTLKFGWNIALNPSKTEEAMSPKTWSQLAIVLVFFAVFVPFYEEYLFRGFIFGWLRRVMPMWGAIAISAAIFSVVHGLFLSRGGVSGWVGTGEIFVLGCVMSWWVAKTNSLWPSYVIHIVNNGLAFVMAFLLPNWP